MSKKLIPHSWHLTKLSVAFAIIVLSSSSPPYAKDDNDPEKVCRIYGCENGIPISGPRPSPSAIPEEPGRPKPHPVPARFCQFYEDANFQGKRDWIQLGAYNDYVGKRWNDRISSISCTPGCTLIAFEHRDFKGAAHDFAGSNPFVGVDWNDRISSMRIRCQ